MNRCVLILVVACSLFARSWCLAVDPPHWSSATVTQDCVTTCHQTHGGLGSTLTQSASNVNLCQSCHNPAGQAKDMPINSSDLAVVGQGGTSHAFNVDATNVTYGTQLPSDTNMQKRIVTGKVVCSTCHDQHAGVSSMGGTPHVSAPKQITANGSTGILSSGGAYSGAVGSWYLVEIQTAGNQTTAKFRYSKDNGTSWMASNLTAGPSVALDSGVLVSFGNGNYSALERWQFYASWPFLRAAIDSGNNTAGVKFCRDCHASWTMDVTSVETYDGSIKEHPVGIALGIGGRTYDRPTPLDGNGAVQGGGSADSNPTNDLKLDSSSLLQCYTCHNPHFADSNTITTDGP